MQYYRKHWNNKTTFKTICFVTPSATLKYCYNVVILFHFYLTITIAERPGVAFEKKMLKKRIIFTYTIPRPPMSVHKNFSPIGPAVWPAIRNMYMNVLFYYIN